MSYILDALKKSEQERGHGNVPGVQTVHSSSLNYRNDKKALWPYVLIAAVILNLLAILYFIVDRDKPTTASAEKITQPAPIAEIQPAVVNTPTVSSMEQLNKQSMPSVNKQDYTAQSATADSREKEYIPADDTVTQPIDNTSIASDSGRQQAETSNSKVTVNAAKEKVATIEFYDLPETITKQLPAIVISAHVYSTNPLQRSIVINDKFMEEGEYVLDDLVLKEITADGAIFDYQGTRFHYGVVSSWQ
jgi:general secretion pathway protein B